jgi:CHAT domain-containing protein
VKRALIALLTLTSCALAPIRLDAPEEDKEPLEGLRTAKPAAFTPEDDITPSASKDGRYLAFASELNGNLDIWVRDHGTNSTYPITRDTAEDFDPAIPPDGGSVKSCTPAFWPWGQERGLRNERPACIVFASRRLDAKGDLFISSIRSIEDKLERLTDQSTSDRQPIYSPDGRLIYFTSSVGIGPEFINSFELYTRAKRRISPTPGFDPAPSPDGKYLVYTAPAGIGQMRFPHLVALRLSDSSTRAITAGQAPEGFARFIDPKEVAQGAGQAIAYVRFADDDNHDGAIDANDQASIWRLELDLDALFSSRQSRLTRFTPYPLTDGSANELFPEPSGPYLYFTQGVRQQDIMRLPITGMFPSYAKPEEYAKLIRAIDDPRTQWFAYRMVLAKTAPTSLLNMQTQLRIGNLHLGRDRPDLARLAFQEAIDAASEAKAGSREAEIGALARLEVVSIERKLGIERADSPLERERVIRATQSQLERLEEQLAWSKRAQARIALELAELIVDRQDRPRAIEAFREVSIVHASEPYSASKAMLREIDLLGIAYDPDALAEAYARVLARFPKEHDAVRAAADRMVRVQLESFGADTPELSWRTQVDALRRLIQLHSSPVLRSAARSALVRLLTERDLLDDAALELERIAEESEGDRIGAARALRRLASIEEDRARLDNALAILGRLKQSYTDLPGYAGEVRDAINRVGQKKAALEETRGNKESARAAYKNIIDNDLTQVKAHRRYLALSAETGKLAEALEEAKQRAERSPRTPMARYAYGLALTWLDKPPLDEALSEIEAALQLNPKLTQALITRGWIEEMLDLEKPGLVASMSAWLIGYISGIFGNRTTDAKKGEHLEKAITSYSEALRLASGVEDTETLAEIWLNDGNASYRLGVKTNDIGNLKRAFDRYVSVLNADYHFTDPRAELVYFERFGRAAAWAGEWAVSAMATRRAIALSQKLNVRSRLAQLHGNLALAYDQAGEDVLAREALAEFAKELQARDLKARLSIAKRNRADTKLSALEERTPEMLDSALDDLADARTLLESADVVRKDLPIWRAAIDDATSAQYGFRQKSELDVNLTLAEIGHRALGDLSRAESVREARRALWKDATDVDTELTVAKEPITPILLREKLGLDLRAARERYLEGRSEEGDRILKETDDELSDWKKGDFADQAALLAIERGRLVALSAELAISSDSPGSPKKKGEAELGAEIERALTAIEQAMRASTSTQAKQADDRDPVIAAFDALPRTLTSTRTIAKTSSIALSPPRLTGRELAARGARARLRYAAALLKMAEGERAQTRHAAITDSPASIEGAIKTWVADLDGALSNLKAARTLFEEAAREAAGAGVRAGGPILCFALDGVAETSRRIADRRPEVIRAAGEEAKRLARALGEEGWAVDFEIVEALDAPEVGLDRALAIAQAAIPRLMSSSPRLVEHTLMRGVRRSLAKGELETALPLLDRLMLFRTAKSPRVELKNAVDPQDRELGARFRRAADELERAREELRSSDDTTPRQVLDERLRRVQVKLAAVIATKKGGGSDGARAKLFAEPELLDLLTDQVSNDEAMLVMTPIDGELHLLLVDGSTTATSGAHLYHRVSGAHVLDVQADIDRVRRDLAQNRAPPAETLERLSTALYAPFAHEIAPKRRLILADALLDGPLPAVITPGFADIALAHVSAPTALGASRESLLVGVKGMVVFAREGDMALVEGGERLVGDRARAFRRIPRSPKGDRERSGIEADRASRSLEKRSPLERLSGRAQAALIVEAPVVLEPRALERSSALLGDKERRSSEPDRFRSELPLESLDMPSALLVLARVRGEGDALRLDLPLAERGFASTVIVPEIVPPDASQRVIRQLVASAEKLGPARALTDAIAHEKKQTPAVSLITLVGSAGLDEGATKRYAKKNVSAAQIRVGALFKKEMFAACVPAITKWIRLLLESGDLGKVPTAYTALVNLLSDRLEKPDPERAAEVQLELIQFLESHGSDKVRVANARIDLGRFYSAARYDDAAEKTLLGAIDDLMRAGDRVNAARAIYQLALHYEERRRDFRQSAAFVERAIEIYEQEKVYEKKNPPIEAMRAIRKAGALYLNRLSDSAKAQKAYERAYRYVQSDEERNGILIDLARVARRRGDFASGTDLIERARNEAEKAHRTNLEADAAIEAANLTWYKGDYRVGRDLCGKSLELAGAYKAEGLAQLRNKRKTKIYALSVCGLVSMSQRDFELAKQYLERAKEMAIELSDRPELATQYNNLGRNFLEFGRLDEAIDSFRSGLAIDTALDDHFALAYDLRNLGTALLYKGAQDEAEQNLKKALDYALEVQDANNELRARFALGELSRDRGSVQKAIEQYDAALPIAQRFEVKELDWQIHRARGLIAKQRGDKKTAEAELMKAVQIARTLTGRAAAADFGPQRYAALDDLMSLLLEQDRTLEAIRVADLARSLEQTEILDDGRISFSSKDVPRLMQAARAARTASAAKQALADLALAEPRIAQMLEPIDPQQLVKRMPKDAAVVAYRVTDEELVAFVVDDRHVSARRTPIKARVLRDQIREYTRRLSSRADLRSANAALAGVLVEPIRELIAGKKRLAIVPHKLLRYVAFPALPIETEAMIDRFVIIEALDPQSAVHALEKPLETIRALPIVALGSPSTNGADTPLPFAAKEIESIAEEFPRATVVTGEKLTRSTLEKALAQKDGVVHFAGHSRIGGGSEGRAQDMDALGGELRTSDGGVSLLDVLTTEIRARLVVLSACSTLLSRSSSGVDSSGDELLSFAQSFQIAGADNVIATTMHVSDIASAILMKRFYRFARSEDAAQALRSAQLVVRKRYPHAAWWATFVLLAR